MANFNVGNLEFKLNQKISSASTTAELQMATKALEKVRTGMVYQADTFGELPAASSAAKQLWLVTSTETLYWSTGEAWVAITSTTYGEVWVWGQNQGTLPIGVYSSSICSPVREFCSAGNWCKVAISGHGGAVKTDGSLWMWGEGYCGGAGLGITTTVCTPRREICSASNWCTLTVNRRSTSAIKTDGSLWSWGWNTYAQLGIGTTTNVCSPVREFCSATNWCFTVAGTCHRLAVKTDGSLWGWGCNSGRLGNGDTAAVCSPVREFCAATNWCMAAAGRYHSLAIKTDGSIWSFGSHTCGATGQNVTAGSTTSPVREISSATTWCTVSATYCASAAVKTDGTLWTWGRGIGGVGGRGNTTDVCSPVREFCSATNWCKVSIGTYNGAAVKTDGSLWTWGCNSVGQLGDATNVAKCSPVREICSATNWTDVNTSVNRVAGLKLKSFV